MSYIRKNLRKARAVGRMLILAVALWVCVMTCAAETLRVTTWNMGEARSGVVRSGAGTNDAQSRVEEAAQALSKLHPDVILLQQVRDWQMCLQLTRALKPADYSVVVCSAFRNGTNTSVGQPQVAILSKRKAYLSWSEAWRPEGAIKVPGGYAFAAIQTGKHKIGVYSLQIDDHRQQDTDGTGISAVGFAQEKSMQRWLKALDACKKWVTNRLEGIVATGAFDPALVDHETLGRLEAAGFINPLLEATTEQNAAGTFISSLAANSTLPPGVIFDRWPVTCDLDLDAPGSTHGSLVRAEPAQIVTPATAPIAHLSEPVQTIAPQVPQLKPDKVQAAPTVQVAQAPSAENAWRPVGTLIAIAIPLLAVIAWIVLRRHPAAPAKPALLAVTAESGGGVRSAYTVVVTPHSTTGSAAAKTVVSSTSRPLVRVEETVARRVSGESESWKHRALAAEQQAAQVKATLREGLLAHLGHWMKEKLVHRLITDRSQLLEMQRTTAQRTLAMDARLAKVEQQIQQQNQAYEQRIIELTRELNTTREENRELIRAQIAKVKSEMEAARARLMMQAKAEVER